MKVTNKTAYATIGCDVQLSENDRLALGIELDKVTNWLETAIFPPEEAEVNKAINNLVAFISKFAIRPSKTNVFTDDSTEDFKKDDETVTTDDPTPEDNVITVDISNCKNMMNLTKIIYHATDENLSDISKSVYKAKKTHVSCISFKCKRKSKEEVVNELADYGYTIASNTAGSLHLDTH